MRTLNAQDCHVLMNLLVKEATGQNDAIQAVDTSSFVSAGELVLSTGIENTINSLSLVLGRTLISVRPYEAKLAIINALNSGEYTSRLRKISYYAREAQASGDWNTQLYTENLKDGADNGSGTGNATASMWVQNQPAALELNFGGKDVWEDSSTIYEYQLKIAFRSEAEFAQFVDGIMTEKANDIESLKEAFNRMTLLNRMAGAYDLRNTIPQGVIDLTAAYNAKYGTTYTGEQLRTTYLQSFLEFFVSTFKKVSDRMTERSAKYHWTPARAGYTLLRHTPKNKQKAILYAPFFTDATAQVLPEIFSPNYLGDITQNGELVNYWQNSYDDNGGADDQTAKIDITPAIPDVIGAGAGQVTGDRVQLPFVLGCLYDEDAIMTDFQMERSAITPLEARKGYRNIWWSFSKNAINDFTENFVLFYMS